MGSTIVTAKKVAFINSSTGVLFYALFEQTYESNVFPQRPRWGCRHFGTAESCMRRIICDAAATEGGILKGKGRSTPTAWLKQWREEMAAPTRLEGSKVKGRFGPGLYAIDPEKQDAATAVLAEHGIQVTDDQFEIDLTTHPQALQDLIEKARVSAWKFIDGSAFHSTPEEWAGYNPAKQKADPLLVTVFYAKQETRSEREHWAIYPSGEIRSLGWAYNAIETLIRDFAIPSEMLKPGSAESMMRAVRARVETESIEMPPDQVIVATRSDAPNWWNGSSYDSLAQKLHRVGASLSTTMKEVVGSDALFELSRLPMAMLRFPKLAEVAVTPQADLLAA